MKMPINPANSGTYCDKDKQHGKTEQQLFYPDSWQQCRILSILNWHPHVMWQYPVSFKAFPTATGWFVFYINTAIT